MKPIYTVSQGLSRLMRNGTETRDHEQENQHRANGGRAPASPSGHALPEDFVSRRGAPPSVVCQGMCNARRTGLVSVPVTRME